MANERGLSCEKISGPGGRNYKTATGEMVEDRDGFVFVVKVLGGAYCK